jgi:putative tricarboxylic transport membrane protein
MKDRLLAVTVMVGALVYLYADMQLPTLEIGDPLGPKIFPALIGTGLFFSGLMLLISTLRASHAARSSLPGVPFAGAVLQDAGVALNPDSATEPTEEQQRQHSIVLLCMVGWTALYYVAFEPVGYVVATIFYMLALLSYFNRGRHVANLLIAAGFTAIAYLVFGKFLGVSMPQGLLGS